MIKSVSYDQHEILQSILTLLGVERFDVDMTYGNGGFYKYIQKPVYKFDIEPLSDEVVKASSVCLPLMKGSVSSCVFDPPFLTYVKAARNHNSIMAKRFGGYWRYEELEDHYKATIAEAARVLKKGGVMIIKCQDIIHNHKMHSTHINIVKWAEGLFRLKDLYILPAKHRMDMPSSPGSAKRTQKHARIHHSYFLVLESL